MGAPKSTSSGLINGSNQGQLTGYNTIGSSSRVQGRSSNYQMIEENYKKKINFALK
jgi:hypothetical protein